MTTGNHVPRREKPSIDQIVDGARSDVNLRVETALTTAAWRRIDTSGIITPKSPDELGRYMMENEAALDKARSEFARIQSISARLGMLTFADNERITDFPLSLVDEPVPQLYDAQNKGVEDLLLMAQKSPYALRGQRWQPLGKPSPKPIVTKEGPVVLSTRKTAIAEVFHSPSGSLWSIEKELTVVRPSTPNPNMVKKEGKRNSMRNPANTPLPGQFNDEIFVASAIWAHIKDEQAKA